MHERDRKGSIQTTQEVEIYFNFVGRFVPPVSYTHLNPLAYIRNEADILKFVDALISNTKGEGKEGDPFWTKSETLLYCALIAYIIFEGPAEDRNMNTCLLYTSESSV